MRRVRPWWLWILPIYFVVGLVLGWGTISPVWYAKPAYWILLVDVLLLAVGIPWPAKKPKIGTHALSVPDEVQTEPDPREEWVPGDILADLDRTSATWQRPLPPEVRSADWTEFYELDDRPFTLQRRSTPVPAVEGWPDTLPDLVVDGLLDGRPYRAWRVHRTWHVAFELREEPVTGADPQPVGVSRTVRFSRDRRHLVCHPQAGTPGAFERWLSRAGSSVHQHALALEQEAAAARAAEERAALTAEPEDVAPAVTFDGVWEQPDYSITNADDLR